MLIGDLPPASALARLAPEFGQRFLLTVELAGEAAGGHVAEFQRLCEEEGVAPAYFADARAAGLPEVRAAIAEAVAGGRAEMGLLYPAQANGAALEALVDEVERQCGAAPLIGRAGRGAAAPHPAILVECGLAIDCSVRPKCDLSAAGGADFRRHPLQPYWLDQERMLLELPQTIVFWGLLRRQGDWLFPALERWPGWRALLARLALLKRIALSHEAGDFEQAIRAIDIALDDGVPVLVFSCRMPSPNGFEAFAEWCQRVFAYLELRRVPNTSVAALMGAVER